MMESDFFGTDGFVGVGLAEETVAFDVDCTLVVGDGSEGVLSPLQPEIRRRILKRNRTCLVNLNDPCSQIRSNFTFK